MANFTIPAGEVIIGGRNLTGTETGTVEAGATLVSTNVLETIRISNADGIVLDNDGTIRNVSTGPAIFISGNIVDSDLTIINTGIIS